MHEDLSLQVCRAFLSLCRACIGLHRDVYVQAVGLGFKGAAGGATDSKKQELAKLLLFQDYVCKASRLLPIGGQKV